MVNCFLKNTLPLSIYDEIYNQFLSNYLKESQQGRFSVIIVIF